MSTDDTKTTANPASESGARREGSSRLKRGATIALAVLVFAFALGRHIHRVGGSASMIFFLVIPAVILFLIIAPQKFGLGEKSRFDLTVGGNEGDGEESNASRNKWRR